MNLRVDWLKQQGRAYKSASDSEKQLITKNVIRHINRWDALTRNMLALSFQKSGGVLSSR